MNPLLLQPANPGGNARAHHRGPVVALLAGAAVLAACGSTGTTTKPHSTKSKAHASSKAKAPAKSGNTGNKPSTQATPTSRCHSSKLSVALVQFEGAAGSTIATYVFTNSGSATCTLFGYPGLGLLGTGGTGLSTTVIRQPAPESTVTLQPSGHAWFMMEFSNSTGYANAQCPTSVSLEITPPNSYHYLVVSGRGGQLNPYGGTVTALHCGTISVQPVTDSNPV